MNGEVLIVDEHTGRILAGRRYNEGMHQAIEAKEGVEIKDENQTLATITLQNYFRLYDKLSGMTGTADDRGRRVQPDLQARRRADPDEPADDPRSTSPTSSTRPRTAKFDAGRRRHRRAPREGPAGPRRHHQRREERVPVAPAAPSAASRTRCSTPSSTRARPRSSPRPAARARSPSRPTWPAAAPTSCSAATPSSSPSPSCTRAGLDPVETPEEYEAAWADALERGQEAGRGRARRGRRRSAASTCSAPSATSRAASTTSCAAAPAGRATRASRRFYLSLQRRPDAAVQRRRWSSAFMRPARTSPTTCRSSRRWSPAPSSSAQTPGRGAELRDPQERPEVRRGAQPAARGHLRRAPPRARGRRPARAGRGTSSTTSSTATSTRATAEGYAEDWDLDQLWTALEHALPGRRHHRRGRRGGRRRRGRLTPEFLVDASSCSDAQAAYDQPRGGARRGGRCASSSAASCSRCSTASGASTSTRWTTCKEGIGLRAMAQRDPLVEYQREGFELFQAMMEAIKEESVGFLFNLEVEVQPADGATLEEPDLPSSRAAGANGQGEPGRGGAQARLRGQGPGRPGPQGRAAAVLRADGRRRERRRGPRGGCAERRRPTTTRSRAPRSTRPAPVARARSTSAATARPAAARPRLEPTAQPLSRSLSRSPRPS